MTRASGERVGAVAGVGFTAFERQSSQSILSLALEACEAAIDDAGLARTDVDGIVSYSLLNDSVPVQAVATGLGVPMLTYGVDLSLGGQAPCFLVGEAARAVEAGAASAVLVFRALKGRSGGRVGRMPFPGLGTPYRYPIGYSAYPMYVGMWGNRFLHETGQGAEDMAAVVIEQRNYARLNDRAVRRQPMTVDEYMESAFVVEPYRRPDCTIEVDGACAVLVTTLGRARDLRHRPAVVAGSRYLLGRRSGLDMGDHLLWDDYTRNYTSHLADGLFGDAGVTRRDVDVAEIYDCFSTTVLMGLEGLGFVGRGESGQFIRSGETRLDGSLPTNTHGGLLAEGYLHGMNSVAEAVMQVQGRAGERQVAGADVAVATSGALMDGSALVLVGDR